MTNLEAWIGKEQSRTQIIDAKQAELMALTLNAEIPKTGTPLPHCWHWAWFNDALPSAELGRDGHAKRGGFLPPVSLPRRMWAGGKIEFKRPILVGKEMTKISTIKSIKQRSGRSGELCIVTIGHQISDADGLCVDEEQNLVFREDPKPDASTSIPPEPPADADVETTLHPDPVLMFRYSALTFNGHRIHYDVDYARDVEGYPDLVFHAPLTATALCNLGLELIGKSAPSSFEYRATAPLFCNQPVRLRAKKSSIGATLWAETPEGSQAMLAEIKG